LYNVKKIDSKLFDEYWVSNKPIRTGSKVMQKQDKPRRFEQLSCDEKYQSMLRKEKHYKNQRRYISRLISVNYEEQTKFLTLTFKENITDVEITNPLFNQFTKRLRRYLDKQHSGVELKYIAVWERQKRGAIHYHLVLFSFPYTQKKKLQEIWGHGFVQVNQVDHENPHAIGNYISKYIAKEFNLWEASQNAIHGMKNKKRFFKSESLKLPITETSFVKNIDVLRETLESYPGVFFKEYDSSFPDGDKRVERTTFYFNIPKEKKLNTESEVKVKATPKTMTAPDKVIIA